MVDSGVVKKPGEVRPFYYDEEGNIYTPPPGPSRPIAPDPFGALRDAGNLIESDRGDEAAGKLARALDAGVDVAFSHFASKAIAELAAGRMPEAERTLLIYLI